MKWKMEWMVVWLLEFVVETEKSASVPPSFQFLFHLSPLSWRKPSHPFAIQIKEQYVRMVVNKTTRKSRKYEWGLNLEEPWTMNNWKWNHELMNKTETWNAPHGYVKGKVVVLLMFNFWFWNKKIESLLLCSFLKQKGQLLREAVFVKVRR